MCVADSAEPKSIDEIRSFGVNIQPAIKGPGSISQVIQAVQAQQISVTKRSANIIHEYRNFLWETDQNGLILNVPEKTFDHCFAPETLIHTTKGRVRIDELVGKEGYLYSRDGKIERFYDVKPTRANADVVCIEFTDGDTLTVTPDHLLLMPNGEWIEAFLLCPLDMIQLGIDGKTIRESNGVSRLDFYQIFGRKILQGLFGWQANILTPSYLGASERGNTKNSSHTSPGWGQGKQRYFKSRIKGQNGSLERTHDTGKTSEAEFVGGQDKTTNKEVAWVRYGKGVAQVAWEESVGKHFSISEKLLSLPQRVFYAGYEKVLSFLRLELQNESQAKTVKRTTRGFRSQTYNLEVENTHCLIANGVLAHNSMDSIRYGMSSLLPVIRRKELIENMPRIYRENKPSNPAR